MATESPALTLLPRFSLESSASTAAGTSSIFGPCSLCRRRNINGYCIYALPQLASHVAPSVREHTTGCARLIHVVPNSVFKLVISPVTDWLKNRNGHSDVTGGA